MLTLRRVIALCVTAVLASHAQVGIDASPAFEVATVKPTAPFPGGGFVVAMRGGPGSADPGRIAYNGVPLERLLVIAYGVKVSEIVGPDWLGTERYDVSAKFPPATTREQFTKMLQQLLIEQLGLKLHRETRVTPIYALTVMPGGHKLKDATAPTAIAPGKGAHSGTAFAPSEARMIVTATTQTMARFAEALSLRLDRKVVDMTGLSGNYDFRLEWPLDSAGQPKALDGSTSVGPASARLPMEVFTGLFGALRTQAGLRLDSRKEDVEVLVVDHISKTPVGN